MVIEGVPVQGLSTVSVLTLIVNNSLLLSLFCAFYSLAISLSYPVDTSTTLPSHSQPQVMTIKKRLHCQFPLGGKIAPH